jgi:hypothetical protein
MKILIVFIIAIALSLFAFVYPKEDPYLSEAEKGVNELLAKAAKQLAKKHGMRVSGEGAGMPSRVINLLILSFRINGSLTQDEARKLLVECVEEFLQIANSDEKIRPYMKNFPFTSENIDLAIFIYDKNGKDVFHPNLEVVALEYGKLVYRTIDKENRFTYKSKFSESYQEALKIVQGQSGFD